MFSQTPEQTRQAVERFRPRLAELIDRVERWAAGADWATRRIDTELDTLHNIRYPVQALLMQHELNRVILQPIGADSPGSEGVVDLYRMPAYDDIATILYAEGDWRLFFRDDCDHDSDAVPLTKESFLAAVSRMTDVAPAVS